MSKGVGKSIYIPFPLRIARAFYALLQEKRGEYFIYSLMNRLGLMPKVARFKYFDGVINIPLSNPEALYVTDYSLFQGLREINFANQINSVGGSFILVDCGAYYGQVSMRLAKLCPRLKKIVAIEANPDNFEVLDDNLSLANIDFSIEKVAISDFSGRAELVFPDGPLVPDSVHIERQEFGSIQVKTLDGIFEELQLDPESKNIALKIDVEGEEEAAICGAENIIRKAKTVVFFLELHPEVLKRKNLTANELLLSVEHLRSTSWYLADKPYLKLSLSDPIFSQIGGERVCDVIGVTVN